MTWKAAFPVTTMRVAGIGLITSSCLCAQPPVSSWSLQGGAILPFGEMKSRDVQNAPPLPGARKDEFSDGFSLLFTASGPAIASAPRLMAMGSAEFNVVNGTSTGIQNWDLQYWALGFGAGVQVSLGPQPSRRGPYLFSELTFDYESYQNKPTGSGWISLAGDARSYYRFGVGVGLGWVAPGSGFTVEAEFRSSFTGPTAHPDDQGSAFWSSVPSERFVRLGVGWTWGAK